eukprot:5522166-Alexandrium_andersonii.AAC.1
MACMARSCACIQRMHATCRLSGSSPRMHPLGVWERRWRPPEVPWSTSESHSRDQIWAGSRRARGIQRSTPCGRLLPS